MFACVYVCVCLCVCVPNSSSRFWRAVVLDRFVNYMTSAVLELTLLDDVAMLEALARASDVLTDIAQYKEDL